MALMQADFFRLGGMPPRMQELLDAMHASDGDRWLPRRLILQNYWMFEEPEVFHFGRGNLMLTGQNESGKSTVLVTAITRVLDMMLTPDRVDTMGSSDRSIRYYLVGKDDAREGSSTFHHRERTAYIALEFERGRSGVFQTVGIGLRSSRDWTNQKVERWGFVMDGSRRVEQGFTCTSRDGPCARASCGRGWVPPGRCSTTSARTRRPSTRRSSSSRRWRTTSAFWRCCTWSARPSWVRD
jgi:AAA domain